MKIDLSKLQLRMLNHPALMVAGLVLILLLVFLVVVLPGNVNISRYLIISLLIVIGHWMIVVKIKQVIHSKRELQKLGHEKFHAQILETAQDGFWITDYEQRILDVNSTYCRMSGYSRQEILKMHIYDFDATENRRDTRKRSKQIQKEGQARFETIHRRKDGSLFDVEISVQHQDFEGGRFIVFIKDVSGKKQIERNYRILFEEMLDGLAQHEIICDDAGQPIDYRFISVNSSFEQMTGLKREDIIGKRVLEVLPKTESYWIQTYGKVALEGETVQYENYSAELGKHFHVRAFQPAPGQFVTVIMDITEQKNAEKDRLALESKLRQAQKLEALGTMVGGVSHELNNILQGMYLYVSLIEDALPDDTELHENLGHLIKHQTRARDLVQQILTFSRKETIDHVPQDITRIIMDALDVVETGLSPNLKMIRNVDQDLYPVACDATQIHQIVSNLCRNAVQAMEDVEQGKLTIALKNLTIPAKGKRSPKVFVQLVVSDTGIGISEEIQSKIFDPFFTTKRVGRGTGLGLSVIHGIVEMMGGDISLSSRAGEGSTFTLRFPAVLEETEREHTASLTRADPAIKNIKRVLIIDDEPSILDASRKGLIKKGFEVDVFTRAQDALDLVQGAAWNYDIIITDLTMPEMSGLELAERLHSAGIRTPIILSTGNFDLEVDEELSQGRIAALLQKPWSVNDLLQILDSVG